MIKLLLALVFACVSISKSGEVMAAPQIRCEIGTTTWCIATFDGSISMQDVGDARVWTLHSRTDLSGPPMKIIETKACSDVAQEEVRLVKSEPRGVASPGSPEITEYVLNPNGCKLRFEIPAGDCRATYRQVMLYGILVGSDKRTQLYKIEQ